MSDLDVLPSETPVWNWFGLTRASYLVIPRLALQAMPVEFQRRFVALLEEFEAFGIQTPDYHVLRNHPAFTAVERSDEDDPYSSEREFTILQDDPWANYRRGTVEACMGATLRAVAAKAEEPGHG